MDNDMDILIDDDLLPLLHLLLPLLDLLLPLLDLLLPLLDLLLPLLDLDLVEHCTSRNKIMVQYTSFIFQTCKYFKAKQ